MLRLAEINLFTMTKQRKKRATPPTVSHRPLFNWFKENKPHNRGKLRDANYSDGQITNWKNRGIPRGQLPKVASLMGINPDKYLVLAGEKPTTKVPTNIEGLILDHDEAEAIKNLRDALPDWKAHVLKMARVPKHDQEGMLRFLTIPSPKGEEDPEDAPSRKGKAYVLKAGKLGASGKPDKAVKQIKTS